MSRRSEAIKKVLDEGADLTEENIQANMEPEPEAKPDNSQALLEAVQGMRGEMSQLREEFRNKEMTVNVPKPETPIVNIPKQETPERPKRKLSFSFTRDVDGRIINATATEE